MSEHTTEGSLRVSHGRGMNTTSAIYLLPADAPEHDRLSAQHRMWLLLCGGLYPPDLELHDILDTPEALVLDVGCGAGNWSFDFARAYPTVKVVGFDLANTLKLEGAPSNFRFIQGDITKDMAQFFGKVDFLHCRAVIAHLKDPMAAFDTLHRCLKPGGAIFLSEGDTLTFSRDKTTLAPRADDADTDNSKSWVSRFLYEIEQLNWKGIELVGRDLSRWLRDHGGFSAIHSRNYYSPFGWDGGEGVPHGAELSSINRVNLSSLALGYKPAFLQRNHAPEEVVNRWCQGVKDEVEDSSVQRFVVFHVAWGRAETSERSS